MTSIKLAEPSAGPSPVREDRVERQSWRDRWFALRNSLLGSETFQRWAASFPLTRGVAKRRAASLFDLVAGFVYSQVLVACVQLDLFRILSAHPQTPEALAARLELPEEAVVKLLAAAESLELVENYGGGRYGVGALGATMVGNTAVAAMIQHHSAFYADLADPVALLKGHPDASRLAGFWPYAGSSPPGSLSAAQVARYSELMSASQPLVAHEILDSYSFRKHQRLLDIGGGEGTFLMQVAERASDLKLALFDLPAVADRASARFEVAGLARRTEVFGGDFFIDSLPGGMDVATLVRVLHDHDDLRVGTLLRAARAALVPGGTLLVAEPMAATAGVERMSDAYFGFYLLAMGRGQPRSAERLTFLLNEAGFSDVRLLKARMPIQTKVLVALKT